MPGLLPLLQQFHGPLSGTTWVSWYQKKHSPTHIYPNHPPSALSIYCDPQHPPCSIHVPKQSFCTTSHQVVFGLPLVLAPSTSYSIHLFTQSLYSFPSCRTLVPNYTAWWLAKGCCLGFDQATAEWQVQCHNHYTIRPHLPGTDQNCLQYHTTPSVGS